LVLLQKISITLSLEQIIYLFEANKECAPGELGRILY